MTGARTARRSPPTSAESARTALVVGATGALGTAICRELRDHGWRVRGLVREGSEPTAVDGLIRIGVEKVVGDLKQPSSLAPALDGVHLVVSSASATLPAHRRAGDTIESIDRNGSIALVELVEAAGIDRFVYLSTTSRDDGPATRAKRAVEKRLASTRVPFTIVRACRFMEIWFSPALGFDAVAGRARIFGSGRAPVSWISRDDVAFFVRASASDPTAERQTIKLGGPEALSQLEAVRVFERLAGRRFQIERATEDELKAEREAATDPLLESYAAFKLDTAAGSTVDMDPVLRRWPFELTPLRDFAARSAGDSPET